MNSLKIIGLVLSFTAAALTAAVQEDSLRYTLVEESSLDNGSEVGSNSFFDLRYPPPIFANGDNAASINREVEKIIESTRCVDGDGNRNASVEVTFLTPSYLSLFYVSAVMCESDIRERKIKGVVNFDLATGEQFDMVGKFDPTKASELFARVNHE